MNPPYNHLQDHAELLTMVATKMDVFHQDLIDMRATQEKMADAIGKLAVIEECQSTTSDAVGRGPGQHPRRADARVGNLTIRN